MGPAYIIRGIFVSCELGLGTSFIHITSALRVLEQQISSRTAAALLSGLEGYRSHVRAGPVWSIGHL